MPKRMYVPSTVQEQTGPRPSGVLVIAGVAGGLGALLGAVGLAIVWTTLPPPPRPRVIEVARVPVTCVADASVDVLDDTPTTYALSFDAAVPSEPPSLPVVSTGPRFEVTQTPLGRGRTLLAAMVSLEVLRSDASAAIQSLQTLVDMRALQPGDRVATLRDPVTRELRRIEYRRSPTEVWTAIRENGAWRAEVVPVSMSTVRIAAGFRVTGSVVASARAVNLQPEVVARLAEVFPSMALPPRMLAGDVVRLLVDEERLNGQFYRYGRVHAVDYRGAYGHRRAFWVGVGGGARGDFFAVDGRTFERGPLHTPVPSGRLTAGFNPRRVHPILRIAKPHLGIDFAAPIGTAVFAAADGVIAVAGPSGPSGNLVVIRHPRLRIESGYAHLSRFAPESRVGARVEAGALIGYVGTTGRSTGPHVHFTVRRAGAFIDPLPLMGIRRAITPEARPLFDATAAWLTRELDRIPVEGVVLGTGGASGVAGPATDGGTAPDSRLSPGMAPLEVAPGAIRSVDEAPEQEGDDPLDESEEAQ